MAIAGLADVSGPEQCVSNLRKAVLLPSQLNEGVKRQYQQVLLVETSLTSSLGAARVADAKATMAMRTRGENILMDLKWLSWLGCLI